MRKWLAAGIILLFIGTSIIPSFGQRIDKSSLPTSRGHWLYVGGSGPGNYSKIQDAIDDAQQGDTVFVYDDSSPYIEGLHLHKSIQLIGENKTTTIINSSEQMTIWSFDYDNILIQGFTLLNYCNYTKESYGVDLSFAENFTLTDTIIIGCHWGVHLAYCSYCSITHNEIQDGTAGITLYDVDTSNLSGNQVTDNECGIELNDASNNLFSHNTFMNNGMSLIDDSYPNSFFGNTVNYKPLLYLENEHDLILDNISVGQLFLIRCENITIRNIEVSNASHGIEIIRSDNCLITDTKLHSNCYAGITFLDQCQNNTISYNNISSNYCGIMIKSYYQSNSIIGNDIRFNKKGIDLEGSKNTIQDNIIQHNDRGIVVSFGVENQIAHNMIANSSTIGLDLFDSSLCLVKSNNFVNNQKDTGFEKYSIRRNYFQKNYWDPSVGFGPKAIWGLWAIIIGFDFWGYPIYYTIPWVQFDWFPARHPYDIGG